MEHWGKERIRKRDERSGQELWRGGGTSDFIPSAVRSHRKATRGDNSLSDTAQRHFQREGEGAGGESDKGGDSALL